MVPCSRPIRLKVLGKDLGQLFLKSPQNYTAHPLQWSEDDLDARASLYFAPDANNVHLSHSSHPRDPLHQSAVPTRPWCTWYTTEVAPEVATQVSGLELTAPFHTVDLEKRREGEGGGGRRSEGRGGRGVPCVALLHSCFLSCASTGLEDLAPPEVQCSAILIRAIHCRAAVMQCTATSPAPHLLLLLLLRLLLLQGGVRVRAGRGQGEGDVM